MTRKENLKNNMKCPKCKGEMEVTRKFETLDARNEKKYERLVYVCQSDDVWVTVEIPKKLS